MKNEDKHRRDADHLWHFWLNKWNESREFDNSMYEFKSMLDFLSDGNELLRRAFSGELRKTHRQCSHTAPVPIEENRLKCAFGVDVTECDILKSLRDKFTEERKGYYSEAPDSEMFRVMGNTCAWHMYTDPIRGKGFLDTSDGWLMDKSDRMFWDNVYESLSQIDEGD